MIVLLWLVTAILASPFESKCRLEAENAALRHQVMVLPASGARPDPSHEPRSAVSGPALPLVSVIPAGPCSRPTGDGHSLASGRLSLLLALEIAFARRAAAD